LKRGICKMCLLQKELLLSHLIPSALYKLCGSEDMDPIRVGDGFIIPTSRQTRDHLLCRECEDILNDGGERWVNPKLCTMERVFPLYDLIVGGPPAWVDGNKAIYYASQNPQIEVGKLSHFALGIFWKASVHSWRGGKIEPLIELGPYSNAIRLWLRGDGAFPRNVSLWVDVAPPERAVITLNPPVQSSKRGWKTFLMHVPGLMFLMNVGRTMDAEALETCFHQNPIHPIFVSPELAGVWARHLAKDYRESTKTTAYLKAKAKRSKSKPPLP
jgi:hypothetical protein